jgi:hypothetical protein
VEQISSLNPSQLNVSEPKVLALVKQWWEKLDMQIQILKANEFSNACKAFLTTLVSKVNSQLDKVTTLQTQVSHLVLASTLLANPPPASLATSTFAV